MWRCALALTTLISGVSPPQRVEYYGPTDEKLIDFVADLPRGASILLNSEGGSEALALIAASIIEGKKIQITISSHCFSSCAEILLPAAEKLIFKERALIGFHYSSQMTQKYHTILASDMKKYCPSLPDRVTSFKISRGVNSEFWKYVLLKLNYSDVILKNERIGGCPVVEYHPRNNLYIPSSNTLRYEYDLMFEGAVCSDVANCRRLAEERFSQYNLIFDED